MAHDLSPGPCPRQHFSHFLGSSGATEKLREPGREARPACPRENQLHVSRSCARTLPLLSSEEPQA